MGVGEVEAFLTHLAVAGKVSASIQSQVKSAIFFLYKQVLESELPWLQNVTQAKTPQRLPVLLTHKEVQAMFASLSGTNWLVASLLYGAGMRLMEASRLRVVREGKGIMCKCFRFHLQVDFCVDIRGL